MALRKRPVVSILQYAVLVIALVFFLTPIFFQVIAGFRTVGETYDPEKIVDFRGLTLESWKDTIVHQDFLHYLKNSAIASVTSTIIIMLFSIPAAYGLAKLRMGRRTRSNLSFEFLSMRMLPGIAVIIPIFVAFKKIGLLYTDGGRDSPLRRVQYPFRCVASHRILQRGLQRDYRGGED